MTKLQMKTAIKVVAEATDSTEQEVIGRMMKKDFWTLYLIDEASK